MLDATLPEPGPGSPQQWARTVAHTGAPRTAFVLSLLGFIGVAVAAVVALWLITDPNLGFVHGAEVVLGILFVLAVSLVLAILGLGRSASWRRAGGRGWLNGLSITLATLAILGVAAGFVLFVLVVVAFVLVLSRI